MRRRVAPSVFSVTTSRIRRNRVPATLEATITAPAKMVNPEMKRITDAIRCTTSSTICITSATFTTVTVGNFWYTMRCRAATFAGRTRALP